MMTFAFILTILLLFRFIYLTDCDVIKLRNEIGDSAYKINELHNIIYHMKGDLINAEEEIKKWKKLQQTYSGV